MVGSKRQRPRRGRLQSPNTTRSNYYQRRHPAPARRRHAFFHRRFTLPLVCRQRFYFGCAANTAETVAAVATGCTINVAGISKTGQEVASASFTSSPPLNPVGQVPQTHAILPATFKILYNMTVVVVDKPALKALGVDSFTYALSY